MISFKEIIPHVSHTTSHQCQYPSIALLSGYNRKILNVATVVIIGYAFGASNNPVISIPTAKTNVFMWLSIGSNVNNCKLIPLQYRATIPKEQLFDFPFHVIGSNDPVTNLCIYIMFLFTFRPYHRIMLTILLLPFCSYLAIMAALACEADFVFIPEDPVPNNWPEKLCKKILQVRSPAFPKM